MPSTNQFTFADQLDARMGWRNHADPVIEGKLYLGKLGFFFLYVIREC